MEWTKLIALLPLLGAACGAPGAVAHDRVLRTPGLFVARGSLTPAATVASLGGAPRSAAREERVDAILDGLSGEQLAATARGLVGSRAGGDCSGFVREVFRRHGVDPFAQGGGAGDNGVKILHRLADRRGALHARARPSPGDLVFFDDTHDRNADGRRNDPLTHVGIVDRVDGDVVTFLHKVDRGVVRSRMSVRHPHERARGGETLNEPLRVGADTGHAPRLTGSLFAGFATIAG